MDKPDLIYIVCTNYIKYDILTDGFSFCNVNNGYFTSKEEVIKGWRQVSIIEYVNHIFDYDMNRNKIEFQIDNDGLPSIDFLDKDEDVEVCILFSPANKIREETLWGLY